MVNQGIESPSFSFLVYGDLQGVQWASSRNPKSRVLGITPSTSYPWKWAVCCERGWWLKKHRQGFPHVEALLTSDLPLLAPFFSNMCCCYCCCCFLFCWDRDSGSQTNLRSRCGQGWPLSSHPPASVSGVLELQVWVTNPDLREPRATPARPARKMASFTDLVMRSLCSWALSVQYNRLVPGFWKHLLQLEFTPEWPPWLALSELCIVVSSALALFADTGARCFFFFFSLAAFITNSLN